MFLDGFLVDRKYVDQKSSADKIFGEQKFLVYKNFDTFPNFQHFSLPNFCLVKYYLVNGTQNLLEALRILITHNIHSRNIRNRFKAYGKKWLPSISSTQAFKERPSL